MGKLLHLWCLSRQKVFHRGISPPWLPPLGVGGFWATSDRRFPHLPSPLVLLPCPTPKRSYVQCRHTKCSGGWVTLETTNAIHALERTGLTMYRDKIIFETDLKATSPITYMLSYDQLSDSHWLKKNNKKRT